MAAPTRWVSWAAVSTLPQAKKVSNADQLAENRAHAARHGGIVLEELVVPGESRSIVLLEDAAARIPAYARLRELIAARAFDVLVYLDRSRLGRKAALSMAIVQLCHDAGIATYETENPPADLAVATGTDDVLIGAIKSVGAQSEIDKFKRRSAMGRKARARAGKFANTIPYGWRARFTEDGARIVDLDPTASAVIRLALVDLYLGEGLGMGTIADVLNERGYVSPSGDAWTKPKALALLRMINRYAGYAEFNVRTIRNGEYVKVRGDFPAILTDEELDAILREQEARAAARRSVGTPHLVSRTVYCTNCGSCMIMDRNNGHVYARCRTCGRQSIRTERVVDAIRHAIIGLESEDVRRAALAATRDTTDLSAGFDAARAGIDKATAALQRADLAYVNGVMEMGRYQAIIDELRNTITQHEHEIERLNAEQKRRAYDALRGDRIEEVRQLGLRVLEDADTTRANAWLRRHIRVWASGRKVNAVEFI